MLKKALHSCVGLQDYQHYHCCFCYQYFLNIFTSRDIMKRFATRPGFHIKIRNFHPDAEFKDLVGATYVSTTDHVNTF